MPRLDRLPEATRAALINLPVQQNDTSPWTPLAKSLSVCRVALVTTAGMHLRTDKPFGAGDPSFRVMPSTSRQDELITSHASLSFDRQPMQRDLNVVFPLERLKELAARREIGSVARNAYSFMGAQRDTTKIETDFAPLVAKALIDDHVDVAVLTPT